MNLNLSQRLEKKAATVDRVKNQVRKEIMFVEAHSSGYVLGRWPLRELIRIGVIEGRGNDGRHVRLNFFPMRVR